ncbi:MAG: LytR/AlgR family response regulator transcription factor [Anaerosomatales bacterium]
MNDSVTVLVVDDDDALVEMIRTGLELDGIRVLSASDGAEAIETLDVEDVDVVVLDIMMPKVDGWMALMEMRGSPETADIPVIMLTGKTQDLAKILAFKQGVQQYVTKPFNLQELSARVQSLAMGRRRMMGDTSRSADGDLRKLAVRKGGRTILLSIDDIVFLSARNKSTYAHTDDNQYLIDLTLGDLEERLSREPFTRVHRSYMINLNKVREIMRADGAYVVVAADRDETQIPVARRQARAFREAVGI